ncbi:hypothetical protein [Brevundimonas sp. SL130]|uniref:hypothetical protein n=1 Tax=Brevundimonas sp. SL130 TaxID=2995143 RepID=UPI00226D3933|nr:hypothetical protein [Brevundimonas sp. SL130]WAC60477.1 hypothetical protein OU998_03250 [Brevundimonas sp. SL130]
MTRDTQNIQDDIAYMRALAQEGRHAPLLAGPFLVTAAVIFGAANIVQWALLTDVIDASPWAPVWLWVGAGLVFGVALAVLTGQMKGKPGFNSSGNRAVGAAWSAVGYGIFATWLGLMARGLNSGDWSAMMAMPTVVFVAYGSAWIIAGTMTNTRWMTLTGVVSYVGAVAMGWFAGDMAMYLVFAGMIFAVAFVPGLILMRQEPSEIV